MLEVRDLHAGYGKSHVLHGVDFCIQPGDIVALLGRNGSGRSTTAKAIMGLIACQGMVRWSAAAGMVDLVGRKPFEIARLGIGYVPENRDIFPRLTVLQNLLLGQKSGGQRSASAAGWMLDDAWSLFPVLRERAAVQAGRLSGGEQQMLALCRTMMGNPQLVLIDEPSEGLAPQMVQQVARFMLALRERGVAVLLMEQKLQFALEIANRCLLMGHGRIVFDGTPAQLLADATLSRQWLEVAG
ncbi:amino acid/amide ABC transporter ATP-binding protein 2, HAAT family [Lampropedia hyalina DSM 16112]|jgi:branched-chain amino acid transport system ATP-binding protein|uniref:Amino acid/amide ABC transporter ATP-binding protein 2, HAAT family n=1 Tax=Lampropedia hyalina DSM 16112 TaxID=1122156 RepID=A0A1M5BRQ5_9BURK|nr:ABC transporter ATP-binding protein [Lampropedia hyalina]SHF45244.1 amino acid/amide ABC transporter ATP-binding protein 2, HAAT family [Lampropedia hyalina DSM 16112]